MGGDTKARRSRGSEMSRVVSEKMLLLSNVEGFDRVSRDLREVLGW